MAADRGIITAAKGEYLPLRNAGRGRKKKQGTGSGNSYMIQQRKRASEGSACRGLGALYLERQGLKRFAGAKPGSRPLPV